jgi:hypothetical protein
MKEGNCNDTMVIADLGLREIPMYPVSAKAACLNNPVQQTPDMKRDLGSFS